MIDPRAIVSPQAELAADVSVGPFSIVGAGVEIGPRTVIGPHAVVNGPATIGADNRIFQFASIGDEPQDKKHQGEPTRLEIGDRNVFRESCTINRGTARDKGVTRIGNDNLFMAFSHVAHDCAIGDHTVFANCASLGGHVEIGDYAIIGGNSAVHQFVRIGKQVMVGGMTGVENDVIPYATVTGNRAHLSGLNLIGLKRRGFSREDIHDLRNAYRMLFAPEGTMAERLEEVANQYRDCAPAMEIVDFIRADSSRAVCQPQLENAA